MKFDVITGNPPYQSTDAFGVYDGSITSSSPIYHAFFLDSMLLAHRVSMIMPARWLYGAGKGMKEFTSIMLNSHIFSNLTTYRNSAVVFPDTEIGGGVLHLLAIGNYDKETDIQVHFKDKTVSSFTSYLDTTGTGIFLPYPELISIYKKATVGLDPLQRIISSRKPFGLPSDLFLKYDEYNLPKPQEEREKDDDLRVYGLAEKQRRSVRFVPSDYPLTKHPSLDKYKVFASYAYGGREFGEKRPALIIGSPRDACTETFLSIGAFDTPGEATALATYLNSKFLRALQSILKTTQHSTTTYRFVPMQDFTKDSDIDWKQPVDPQLYKKYGLTQEEIDFIESTVQPMN